MSVMHQKDNMNRDLCGEFEARLETALEARASGERPAIDRDLTAHVETCTSCRAAFEDAELGRSLLRWGIEAAPGAGLGFSTRVMAQIRAEQVGRESSGSIFWRPVEMLAGRFAMGAAALVLALSVFVYEGQQPNTRGGNAVEMTELVQQPDTSQPQSLDEVLASLAERPNGR
jgi:hypothetical protein